MALRQQHQQRLQAEFEAPDLQEVMEGHCVFEGMTSLIPT